MAKWSMFTSISKQPKDLGGISVQIWATCEIWGTESNFKYLLWEGDEKQHEVKFWHHNHSLHSTAHTSIVHCAHMWRCKNMHTTRMSHLAHTFTWPLWNPNPKSRVYRACRSLNTLANTWLTQSILITLKCPKPSLHYCKPKMRPDGFVAETVGAALLWTWDRAQSLSAGKGVWVSGPRFSLNSRSSPGVEKRNTDPMSAGSHNQQHMKAVLCDLGLKKRYWLNPGVSLCVAFVCLSIFSLCKESSFHV